MSKAKVKSKFYKKEVLKAVDEAVVKPFHKAGLLVETAAKKSMRTGGRSTGPKGGKVRTPSTPPAPPNVQSGNLRAAITAATDTAKGKPITLVGATRKAWYGQIHEHGLKGYPVRAFMRPALTGTQKQFPALFKDIKLANTRAGRALNSKKGKP